VFAEVFIVVVCGDESGGGRKSSQEKRKEKKSNKSFSFTKHCYHCFILNFFLKKKIIDPTKKFYGFTTASITPTPKVLHFIFFSFFLLFVLTIPARNQRIFRMTARH